MLADLGFTVLRNVPEQFVRGISSGLYSLHGGVVRDVSGRIVAHLAMPSEAAAVELAKMVPGLNLAAGVAQAVQTASLAQDVHQVMHVAMAATVVSGLGLVTSIVGFSYLNRRVAQVDRKLDELGKQAKEIKQILQSQQRSRLLAAVDDYRLATEAVNGEDRRQVLRQAQSAFGELAHHYKSRMAESSALAELQASEGYFVAACLGNAICTSDLGMGEPARQRLEEHVTDWTALARQQCVRLLQLNDPVRLLDSRYVDRLPTSELVSLLDFAHGTHKGIDWMDDLRRSLGKGTMLAAAVKVADEPVIEFTKTLKARHEVLRSYVAHFGFLAETKVSATEFSAVAQEAREREGQNLVWMSRAA